MSRPVNITYTLAAASDNAVALNQTPGAAGNLTLNGAAVTGGVAILDAPRRVLVTTASNESAKTLTIYGNQRVDGTGNAISETMTGPNATTGYTTQSFGQVTRVAVSAAFTGNVKVGTNGIGDIPAQLVNYEAQPVNLSIAVVVTGTVTYSVQYTYDDIMGLPNPSSYSPTIPNPVWFNDPTLVSYTATGDTTFNDPIQAWRVSVLTGTGSLAIKSIQAGIRG